MLSSETEKAESCSKKTRGTIADIDCFESSLEFEQETEVEIDNDPLIQNFYVCFCGDNEYFMSKFFKKGFTHVAVFKKLGGLYIMHDPNRFALDTGVLPGDETEDFIKKFTELRPDYTVLEVTKRATLEQQPLFRVGVQSCVTVMSYLLGIKMPWYKATPHALYKTLKKGGQGIISTKEISHGHTRNG